MSNPNGIKSARPMRSLLAVLLLTVLVLASSLLGAQTPPEKKSETRITPAQAKQLFALVDELMKFSSTESGLPIKSPVKRMLITRADVETYLNEKLQDDKSTQRLERDEIVLKKFGLLDRDFDLGPFLVQLLKEQIEAFYDEKTQTVNLLDWVSIDEQKPVLAHELTHALQDQHVPLATWGEQTPDDVSTNSAADATSITRDEWDTAREAITEGQATAVMTDYALKPLGKTIVSDPEVIEVLRQQMTGTGADSPVMARAPLLLTESMLFPYREGLSFEQDIWMDQGQHAAFAGALDTPPSSTWEIMNPLQFEHRRIPPVPLLPNIHPIVDALYTPYDIGQIGQLDLDILTKILGGEKASRSLTPAWDGGLYWAGQLKSAKTKAEKASTASLGLFYLSVWKNQASAEDFARLYAENLGRKYSAVQLEAPSHENAAQDAAQDAAETSQQNQQVYTTSEGPVILTQRGPLVFISESFPKDVALKLTGLILNAQGTGATQFATAAPAQPALQPGGGSLTGSLVHLFAHSGVLKSVVRAQIAAASQEQATHASKNPAP